MTLRWWVHWEPHFSSGRRKRVGDDLVWQMSSGDRQLQASERSSSMDYRKTVSSQCQDARAAA
jgi:hypothetical protein